jgi:hypothetical protein
MSDLVEKIQIIREQREKKSSQNKQKRPDQVKINTRRVLFMWKDYYSFLMSLDIYILTYD